MAEPFRYRALLAIQAALQTLGTVAGDYHVVKADSVFLDPQVDLTIPDSELPAFLVHPDPDGGSKDYSAALQVRHTIAIDIVALNVAPGSATTRKTIAGERLIADIERALVRELVAYGGVYSDLEIGEGEMIVSAGPDDYVSVRVPLRLVTHRTFGQP
jgi:hypothetical protein